MPTFNPVPQELAFTLLLQASNGGPSGLLSEYVREGGPADVYVKRSPIHGEGLFARRTFATGETILVRDERPITPERPLDPARDEFEHHCDRLDGGRLVYIGYPARYVNHSCEPNAFLRRQGGLNHLVALRPIRPHEEIVRHYGVNLWDGEPWRCNCGSERCIGTIPADFFSLPLDVQIELSPLLAPWFVFEHRDLHRAFLREGCLADYELS